MVNGPESKEREIAGYGFDLISAEVEIKFGSSLFLDPHDIAVTSDGREVIIKVLKKYLILNILI